MTVNNIGRPEQVKTIGDYYDQKRKDAVRLSAELKKALDENLPNEKIRQLQKKLELAHYVGD